MQMVGGVVTLPKQPTKVRQLRYRREWYPLAGRLPTTKLLPSPSTSALMGSKLHESWWIFHELGLQGHHDWTQSHCNHEGMDAVAPAMWTINSGSKYSSWLKLSTTLSFCADEKMLDRSCKLAKLAVIIRQEESTSWDDNPTSWFVYTTDWSSGLW